MGVSVGVGADDRAALSTKAVNCAADLVLNRGHFVRTISSRSCGKSRLQSRTRSARDDATDPAPAVVTIVARFWARIRATSCTSSDAPTITPSMLDLCSASCKARRFAPPTRVSARGLRALTAPARSSPDCNCVMATPCASSRSQATPVSGNRSGMRSIGSEGKTSATAQPPGRKHPRLSAPTALRARSRAANQPADPLALVADKRPAHGLRSCASCRPQAASVPEPSQSSVTFRAQGPGAQTNNPGSPEEACSE